MPRQDFDLSVYLVTDAHLCGPRGIVETAIAAASGGATIVQLRDPHAPTRRLVEEARALVEALRAYQVPLIVNDRVDVALASGAAGVHVGQSDMAPGDVRALLGPDAIVGLSVGSDAELARSDLAPVDYVGIGPVNGTATKQDAGAAIGIDGFAAFRPKIALPAVAIGGVKAEHAAALMRAGADGVAVVSAICGAEDPVAAAREIAAEVAAGRH